VNVKRIFNLTSDELETAITEWLKNEHDVDTDDAAVEINFADATATVTIEGEE